VPEPPLTWELFDGQKNLVFDYVCIKLWETPREELLALNQPGLLPLSLLTKGEVNRIIVKEMFDELLANKLNDLLPVGQTIATWVLGATDLAWLKREYHKMLDFFKDSPAYEWMTEDAREEERQRSLEERQQNLEILRQTIVMQIAARFPKLERLAKKQVRAINDIKAVQQTLLRYNLAKNADDVEALLLDIDEKDGN
jgi:predicted transposase YdaD